ncbi:uncharacterized protein PFL1_05287 [Pseudozyma flocculosa PF-1]|uniref:Copper acquisition factor BIM1-like domain-containing protein n=1 Tax=Pseudozyma flocculosa PF-1 TaxID=1277687 RepID=A0A061H2R4_9BASI|nr:uncharacterized protein PFL1_05287 [Pseudozyma flocculosa PF-1]EPQ27002.1 hypothetical protein PFL1_05287 [Pseudozyma flocculosa PF-1]
MLIPSSSIYLSLDEKPTGPESFLKTSAGGASIPPLRKDLAISGQGEFCFHANASALDVPGSTIADGTNATIMVEFISVHGHLYQCSDVRFTSDASVGANLTCTDSLKANAAAAAGSTSSTPASTSSGGPAAPSATAPTRSGGSENAASSISPSLFASLVAAAAAAAVASALGPGISCLL